MDDDLYSISKSLFSMLNMYLKDNVLFNTKYKSEKPLYFTEEQCEQYAKEIKCLNISMVKKVDLIAQDYLDALIKMKEKNNG